MPKGISFVEQCVKDTIRGLKNGLNQFSSNCKAAVIYAIDENEPLKIYDPEGLLPEHALKLKDFYFCNAHIKCCAWQVKKADLYSQIIFEKALRLDGIFCNGGSSSTVFHQMWFISRPPDICSTAPFISWLTYAALRFSHDVANTIHLYTGVSGQFLREYANYAIHTTLVNKFEKHESSLQEPLLHDILEAILEISRTHEEGKLPYGKLLFTDTETIHRITFNAKFTAEDLPRITSYKHVRKLLQSVEKTSYRMISDGKSIIGISNHLIPGVSITADYEGKHGFLFFNDQPIASFSDGKFFSTTHKAKLVEIEEVLLDYRLPPAKRTQLFHTISELVHFAQKENYGCAILLDLSKKELHVSGQPLESPLDLNLPGHMELAKNLSKVDGAIHIKQDHQLHSFACLLDGSRIEQEDRSRGARYNSSLRFTSVHKDTVIVVVSSDQNPVSVIYQGQDLTLSPQKPPDILTKDDPIELKDWITKTCSS